MPELSDNDKAEIFRMLSSRTWGLFLLMAVEEMSRHRKNVLSGTLTKKQYRVEVTRFQAIKSLIMKIYDCAEQSYPPNLLTVFE